MNPIPISWCLGGAGIAALLGAWGGWTVRDWKADGDALKGLKTAIITVENQRKVIDGAADAYEKDRTNGQAESIVRENTIREYYRTAPAVATSCAAPDAVGRLLDDALATASARARGQPAPGLPTTTSAAEDTGRPRASTVGSSAD